MKRFFRVIVRINAVLICLAGFLAVALLAYGLISMLPMEPNHADAASIQASRKPSDDKDQLSVERAEQLAGTKIVRLEVRRGPSGYNKISGFSRAQSSGICNYIFFDAGSNDAMSLFPSNGNFVEECNDFCLSAPPDNQRILKWSAFIFADKDTNGDGVVNGEDRLSVGVTAANGQGFHVYLTDLARVLTTQLDGENDLCVYYVQDKSVFVAHLDLSTQKIVLTKKLF